MDTAQYQQGHLYLLICLLHLLTISYHVGADEEEVNEAGRSAMHRDHNPNHKPNHVYHTRVTVDIIWMSSIIIKQCIICFHTVVTE